MLRIIIGLVCMGLILVSCNKKKWLDSVSTSVEISLEEDEVDFNNGVFVVDTVFFAMKNLTIGGSRLQEEDIHLINGNNLSLGFLPNQFSETSFMIPQGTYSSMNLSGELNSDEENNAFISGNYYFANGTTHSVKIYFDETILLGNQLLDTDGDVVVLIDSEIEKSIELVLDLDELFDAVNPGHWTAANVSGGPGNTSIIITAQNNSSIYSALLAQMPSCLNPRFQ